MGEGWGWGGASAALRRPRTAPLAGRGVRHAGAGETPRGRQYLLRPPRRLCNSPDTVWILDSTQKEREHLGVWDRHAPTLLSSFAVNTASLRPGLQQQRSGLELGTRVRVGPAQVKPCKCPDPARPGRQAHVPTVTPGPGPTRV